MRTQLLALLILALLPRLSMAADSPADGIWVFEDTTASLSFEDVVAMPDAFVQTTDTNIGFSDSAFWIRVELTNDTDERQTQVVQFRSQSLPLVKAYELGNGIASFGQSGFEVSQVDSLIPMRLPSFPVTVEANSGLVQYFQIRSTWEIDLGHGVVDMHRAISANTELEIVLTAIGAALGVLFFYNVFVAVICRQESHAYYSGFIGCFFVAHTATLFPQKITIGPVSLLAGAALSILFLLSFFDYLKSKFARWTICAAALLGLFFGISLGRIELYKLFINVLAPLSLLLIGAIIVFALVQRKPRCRIIFFGWSIFVIGVALSLFSVNGNMPPIFTHSYALGNLFEAIVFSLALAYRLRDQDQTAELLEQQRQTSERQKEMFAVIGHELRTPVASMAMVADDNETSESALRQQVKSISSNLLSVLEDLRVVVAPERALESKLEVGHPANKVERAISPLTPMVEEAGFSVSLVLPTKSEKHYHLHAQPLRQLVTNLVKNAVVHSGGDKVQVELTLDETDATQTQATLRISDNGKGLSPTEQKHVFEAFGRGDTSRDGSGLGLFIVSQLVKKMEGSLSYETSKLGGACFVVSFPMQVAKQAQAQDLLSGLNILLAEDDSFLAQLTQKMLSAKGANVTVAENGQIALDAFQTHVMTQTFDVVITDLMMPELDGHGLVKAIRESDTQVPVIAVTAAVIGQETDRLMAEGATAVLSKPIKVDELAEVLSSQQAEEAV